MKKFFKFGCLGIILLIVLGIIIGIVGGGDEETTNTNSTEQKEEVKSEESKQEEKKVAGIGETATVADVGFTVQNVEETNEIDSGNEFIENATTDGKFIIADIKIDNGQKEALTIDSSFFKIITADGTEYEPVTDGTVFMAMSQEDDFFLQQINPGLSKAGKVVFEVPADLDLATSTLYCQTGFFGTESIEIKLSK